MNLMGWMLPSSISVLVATLIMALVYWYLYAVHRDRYLKLWAASWSVYSFRYLFLIAELTSGKALWLTCGYQIAAIVSAILLIWGTQLFSGARIARWWVAVGALGVAWTIAANSLGLKPMLIVMPIFCLLAFADFQVGYSLWMRSEKPRSIGVTITAVNFFLWGVHKLNYPVLRYVEWFAPVGYLLGGVFAMLGALGMVLVFFERMRASMAKEEERLRKIMDCTSDGLYLSNPEGVLVEVNLSAAQKLGYEKSELIGKPVRDISVDFDEVGIKDTFRRVLEGESVRFLEQHRRKDGTTIPVELMVSAVDFGGRSFFLGSARDLSAEQLLADERRKSNLLFRDLLMATTDGFMLLDMEMRIVDVNTRACSLLGYSREELLSMSVADVDAEMTEEAATALRDKIVATGEGSFETRHRRKDGNVIDVEVSNQYQPADGGRFVSFFRDITERKRAEGLLRDSEAMSQLLLQSVAEGIYCVGIDGRCTFCNKTALSMFGFQSEGEVLRKNMHDLIHYKRPDGSLYPSTECKIYRAFMAGLEVHADDEVFWRADGTSFPAEYWSYPMKREGEVVGAVVSFLDISERLERTKEKAELETRLFQAQKMEAVGTLAGGIAHDFNNILGSIIGYTELTLSALPQDSEERENLQEVLVASGRAKELVKQILAFGRKGEKKVVSVDSGLLVNEAMKLLVPVIPKTIKIEREIDLGAGHVLADPTELHQVIMNLCTNAYQAMPEEKGILHVRLSSAVIEPLEASSVPGLSAGEYVRLEVIDNGSGMDQETLARIFEPYYTTKSVGKGTGLGLALVHGIVTSIGGAISVRSTPGIGTSFVVYLPRTEPVQAEVTDHKDIASLRGLGKVLVVDDEPALARLAGKMLESLGYKVRVVSDPLEAIRVFESDPQGFDAIVTDQTMPRLTGAELVCRAKLAKPAVAAVMCTGYSDLIDEEGAKKIGVAAYVQKPYDKNHLGVALAAALGQHT